jgi:hypothetical protein
MTFPQKPQELSQELDSEIGKLKMTIYSCESADPNDSNASYGLVYTDYPESKISSDLSEEVVGDFFDGAIRGMVADRKGSITSLLKSSYKNAFPAKFVKISFAEEHTVMNLFLILIHNRFYLLQVGCDKNKDDNTLIKKFFRSFEYTGPMPVPVKEGGHK